MDPHWEARFKFKFAPLREKHRRPRNAVGISLKFRVPGGFYPWHSQEVFDKIEEALKEEPFKSAGAILVQHETGPEILFWGLSVAKAALIVSTSILAVSTANLILNVRKKANAQGPIQVMYRGGGDGNYAETALVTTDNAALVKQTEFEAKIEELMDEWLKEGEAKGVQKNRGKKTPAKKTLAKKTPAKKTPARTRAKKASRKDSGRKEKRL